MPSNESYENIISHNPDGIVLSNGPGDPFATGKYAVPLIQKLIKGEKVSLEQSGLSKREWNELMESFGFKEKIL